MAIESSSNWSVRRPSDAEAVYRAPALCTGYDERTFHPEARYIAAVKGTWWVSAGSRYNGAKDDEVTLRITGIGPSATKQVDESGQVK